jgi:hypothetical protein
MEEQSNNTTERAPASDSPILVGPSGKRGFCRLCGKPVLEATAYQISMGLVYCEEHREAGSSPYESGTVPSFGHESVSPAGAFLLGFIPGVGAIYNGQYAKGLLHAVIFGLLIALANADALEPIEAALVLLTIAFYIYMPFEAYKTARRRMLGMPLDEFSGLIRDGGASRQIAIVGPALMIGLGVIAFLANLGIFDSEAVARVVRVGWPVLLIGVGIYLLLNRLRLDRNSSEPTERANVFGGQS